MRLAPTERSSEGRRRVRIALRTILPRRQPYSVEQSYGTFLLMIAKQRFPVLNHMNCIAIRSFIKVEYEIQNISNK